MNARFQNLPIAAKVALAPALVLLCLVVLAGVGHYFQQQSAQAMQRYSAQTVPYMKSVAALKQRTAQLDAMVMRSLAYEGSGMKAKRIEALDKAIAAELSAFTQHIGRMKASASAQDQPHFEAIAQRLAKFGRMATDTLDMKSGGLSAAAMMMTSAESEFREFEKAVDALVAAVDARERAATADTLQRTAQAGSAALAMVGVAIAFSLAVIVLSVRMITRPLAEAVVMARRVAEGDLSSAIQSDRRDEAGQVLNALAMVSQRLGP